MSAIQSYANTTVQEGGEFGGNPSPQLFFVVVINSNKYDIIYLILAYAKEVTYFSRNVFQ